MMARWLAFAAVLAGCGGGGSGRGGADPGPDLPADVPAIPDVAYDVAAPDPAGDASTDVAADPAGDVVPDPQSDPAPEAGPDAAADAADLPPQDLPPQDLPTLDLPPHDLPPQDVPISPCPRLPAPQDRDRKVAVSHPYAADGGKGDAWELVDLSEDGQLTLPKGPLFHMGRAGMGDVVFTPDGEVGIAAQDDATLGVFRVLADGSVEVVHAAFQGSFYPARVVMDPAGDVAWVLDSQWRNNGGGVYRVRIGCDGKLTDDGIVVPAKLPYALAFLPDGSGRGVLAAKDVLDVPGGKDFHLLQWGATPSVIGSAAGFPDTDAIIASLAVSADSRFVLAGDNAEFSGTGNRVAVVGIGASGLSAHQVLSPVEDPIGLAASPFGGVAIAVSGYGNAVLPITWDAAAPDPVFAVGAEPQYEGKRPQLPGNAVTITRGKLAGRVLIGELSGVRQVALAGDGSVTDLGAADFGEGLENMVGAVGVQP